jgi:hypothetical protein
MPARPVGRRFADPQDIQAHDQMLAGPARLGNYVMPKDPPRV